MSVSSSSVRSSPSTPLQLNRPNTSISSCSGGSSTSSSGGGGGATFRLTKRADSFNVLNNTSSNRRISDHSNDNLLFPVSPVEVNRRHGSVDGMSHFEMRQNRRRDVLMPLEFLNRSFDGVDTMQSDDDGDEDDGDVFHQVDHDDDEHEEKLEKYRRIISEMNRNFEEKIARSSSERDGGDDERFVGKLAKKIEFKGKKEFLFVFTLS